VSGRIASIPPTLQRDRESIDVLCAFELWMAEHSILVWSDYI
jgi:hypothetical protein